MYLIVTLQGKQNMSIYSKTTFRLFIYSWYAAVWPFEVKQLKNMKLLLWQSCHILSGWTSQIEFPKEINMRKRPAKFPYQVRKLIAVIVDFRQTLMEFQFPPLLPRRGRQTQQAQPSLVTSTGRESVRLHGSVCSSAPEVASTTHWCSQSEGVQLECAYCYAT